MESETFQVENPMRKRLTRKKNNGRNKNKNKNNNNNNARKTKKRLTSLAAYKSTSGKKEETVESKPEEKPKNNINNNNNNNNNSSNLSKLKRYTPSELVKEEEIKVETKPAEKNVEIFQTIFEEGDEKLDFPKINFQEAKTPFEILLQKIREKSKVNTAEAKAFAELYAKIFVYIYILAQLNYTEEYAVNDLENFFKESTADINLETIFTKENLEKLQEAVQRTADMNEQVEAAYFLIKPKSDENPEYKEQLIDSKDLLLALPKVKEIL